MNKKDAVICFLENRIKNLKILQKYADDLENPDNTWMFPADSKRLSRDSALKNTVALCEAIKDLPDSAILKVTTEDEIYHLLSELDKKNCIHAILQGAYDILLVYPSYHGPNVYFVYSRPFTYTECEHNLILCKEQ